MDKQLLDALVVLEIMAGVLQNKKEINQIQPLLR
jgi:hypothetical protein